MSRARAPGLVLAGLLLSGHAALLAQGTEPTRHTATYSATYSATYIFSLPEGNQETAANLFNREYKLGIPLQLLSYPDVSAAVFFNVFS